MPDPTDTNRKILYTAESSMLDDSAIRLWILGLPDGQRGSKRPRAPDMDTPPTSSFQTRSQSPSKKRKVDQDGAQDPGATPRSGPPSQWPAFFHPPSSTGLGHSSTPTLASNLQSSRRSASPVKTITRLQRLDKPVLYRSLDDGMAGLQQLPKDVGQLYCDLSALTTYRTGIYPAEIRPQIESLLEGFTPPDSAYRKPEGGARCPDRGRLAQDAGKEKSKEEEEEEEDPFFDYLPLSSLFADRPEAASPRVRRALAEFYKIRAIERVARECLDLRRSEAAWNARVHGPLLELALSRRRGICRVRERDFGQNPAILPPVSCYRRGVGR